MHFALQPSPILKRVVFASHAFSLLLLWLTHWHFTAQFLLSLLIVLSLFHYFTLRPNQFYSGFTLEDDQSITLIAPPDITLDGKLASGTFITPLFVVLHIQTEQRWLPITLIVFYDALPCEVFRQLRIRLKYAP